MKKNLEDIEKLIEKYRDIDKERIKMIFYTSIDKEEKEEFYCLVPVIFNLYSRNFYIRIPIPEISRLKKYKRIQVKFLELKKNRILKEIGELEMIVKKIGKTYSLYKEGKCAKEIFCKLLETKNTKFKPKGKLPHKWIMIFFTLPKKT